MWWIPIAQQGAKNTSTAMSGYGEYEGMKEYNDYLQKNYPELLSEYKSTVEGGVSSAAGTLQPYVKQGNTALSSLSSWQAPEIGSFAYDKTVQDFLDPSMAYQNQQQQAALAESQMAKGRSLGGAAAKELTNLATTQAQTDYANSYDRMTQDKAQTYQQFMDYYNSRLAASQQRLGALQSVAGLGSSASANLAGMQYGSAQNVAQANLAGNEALLQSQAARNAAGTSYPWQFAANLVGGSGQGASSFYGSGNTQQATQQQNQGDFLSSLTSMFGSK